MLMYSNKGLSSNAYNTRTKQQQQLTSEKQKNQQNVKKMPTVSKTF